MSLNIARSTPDRPPRWRSTRVNIRISPDTPFMPPTIATAMTPASTPTAPAFSLPVLVYYEDTDAGGVVYHSQYINFLERARTEYLRDLGVEQDALLREHGIIFAVRSVSITYLLPARFNDLLDVTVSQPRGGRASLEFDQDIRRGDSRLVSAQVTIVCLEANTLRPRRIPAFLHSECRIEH